jgi:hypothetical protein
MKSKRVIKNGLLILNIIYLSLFLTSCASETLKNIVIENKYFIYEIGKDGNNLHFTDKATGRDYLDSVPASKCAYIIRDGKRHDVTGLSLKRNNLIIEFGKSGVIADVMILHTRDHITFKVTSVSGNVESLTFLNIPLTLEGMPYESFAACVLSMNLFTHVRQIPALQTDLWATCYNKFGLVGAEITLLGLPPQKILSVIRKVMKNAKDVPYSDKGGAWALMQKEGYGSYLMNFGTLTEETVDKWIETCRSLGFNQIDNHGGSNFFKFGDFELNKEKWPDGWESFKRINARLHEAGISSIFHSYTFFIDKNSKYVTPIPSEDLGYFNSFTLEKPLAADADEIVVRESTANISTIIGFHVENSVSLRIGSELVEFSGVTHTPPYKFTGCKRGVNGTKQAAHTVNEKVFHLTERFGRFAPGPETPLFDEIARRTAEIVSNCGFDGIYFDAIDGSAILGGEENFWYYGTKFVFEVAKNLKHPVGMEMSSMSHHWWHYRSRWQAWDRPVRGYKRFVDIHLAAIKSPRLFLSPKIMSNENEHGLWRGHSPLIDKFSAIENGGLLLPLHLGWWGNQTWNPPQMEPTFPDDIEYLCCKMIGNNAGLSMLGGVDKKTLDSNPLFVRLIPIIKQYEELRYKNYFNDTIRALLRQPGKEYTLFQDENGNWNFKPITYQKHKVEGIDHPSSHWIVQNEFESQPVKLRIEILMSVKRYNDPANIKIADFSESGKFINEGCAIGVSGGVINSDEKTQRGEKAGNFYAQSSGSSPQEGSWIKMERKFDPWLNLNNNQGLGVWIKGDGNGQLLNFKIGSPIHISNGARGDHFIRINFTGWKYFELVEIESSEFSNYIWPDESGFYVYNSYMHSVQFKTVDKLQLWYNNLPAGKEVRCLIGPVKALPLVPVSIENPSITIGNEKIVFPVRMESGMYFELRSATDCKLFGPKGEFIQDISVKGTIPAIGEGQNNISFTCNSTGEINPRLQITVISEGKPLEK